MREGRPVDTQGWGWGGRRAEGGMTGRGGKNQLYCTEALKTLLGETDMYIILVYIYIKTSNCTL